jgi:POT family proton-dependent oligopeptide transporter
MTKLRWGFQRSFWIANLSELFERLAFYGPQAVLAIYLHEELKFSPRDTGSLMGYFGFASFSLPLLSGTLADRFGFRRSLLFAYLVLSVGYLLMGSVASPWLGFILRDLSLYDFLLIVFLLTALGPSFVKPCVVATTAKASRDEVRTLGYSIYYAMMSVGAAFGPVLAYLVRKHIGIRDVFRVSAFSTFAMFLLVLAAFQEPGNIDSPRVRSTAEAFKNFLKVLANRRFIALLAIYSVYWMIFWQVFVSMPLYVRGYIDPHAKIDLILSVDPLLIMCFQMAVSAAIRRKDAIWAMAVGLSLCGISMAVLATGRSIWAPILALAVLALGEMIQAPRYYDYIARLAPANCQGLFMGWAFFPVGFGYLLAGQVGGLLVHRYCEVFRRPAEMWLIFSGIGLLSGAGLWFFGKYAFRTAPNNSPPSV